jgi:hypothetical protein
MVISPTGSPKKGAAAIGRRHDRIKKARFSISFSSSSVSLMTCMNGLTIFFFLIASLAATTHSRTHAYALFFLSHSLIHLILFLTHIFCYYLLLLFISLNTQYVFYLKYVKLFEEDILHKNITETCLLTKNLICVRAWMSIFRI